MEHLETGEQLANRSTGGHDHGVPEISAEKRTASSLVPQACATCGAAPANTGGPALAARFIYAIGRIEPRFPSLSVEMELKQAIGRLDTKGLTDRQALHAALSKPENRYLVRQLCWVMTIAGLDTYIVVPIDPSDYSMLVDTVRPEPQPGNYDIVIGVRGSVASPGMCNGLLVPLVGFDMIYSFDRQELVNAVPNPHKVSAKAFVPAAESLLDTVMQMADNAGDIPEHRAVNWIIGRLGKAFEIVAEAFARNCSLSAVDVQHDSLGGAGNIVRVIFSFTNRTTDVTEQFFARINVSEKFPFLVTNFKKYIPVS